MPPPIDLARPTLERQHSLITRWQAIERGLTVTQIDALVRSGVWEVIDRALYGPVGVAMDWERRQHAAVLCAPATSLASHRACAMLRNVGGLSDPPVEITIPRGTTFRRPDVIVHESCDLHLAAPVEVRGIPTTGLRRLAMDLGCVVSFERFKHTIREIRHVHGVTSEQLLSTYLAHKARGRNGGAALRDWLDRYFHVRGVPESGIELVVLDALIDAGFPTPVAQHWVDTGATRYRLDLAYPDQMICIEVDGRQHRDDADVAANDAARTRRLKALGWTVLRIRSDHLATDLAAVMRKLRRLLRGNCVD